MAAQVFPVTALAPVEPSQPAALGEGDRPLRDALDHHGEGAPAERTGYRGIAMLPVYRAGRDDEADDFLAAAAATWPGDVLVATSDRLLHALPTESPAYFNDLRSLVVAAIDHGVPVGQAVLRHGQSKRLITRPCFI